MFIPGPWAVEGRCCHPAPRRWAGWRPGWCGPGSATDHALPVLPRERVLPRGPDRHRPPGDPATAPAEAKRICQGGCGGPRESAPVHTHLGRESGTGSGVAPPPAPRLPGEGRSSWSRRSTPPAKGPRPPVPAPADESPRKVRGGTREVRARLRPRRWPPPVPGGGETGPPAAPRANRKGEMSPGGRGKRGSGVGWARADKGLPTFLRGAGRG